MARRPFPSRESSGVWDLAFARAKISRSQLRAQASPAAAVDIVLDQPPTSPPPTVDDQRAEDGRPGGALAAASVGHDAATRSPETSAVAPLVWDDGAAKLVESVNRFVNQTILPATDLAIYGVGDFWSEPITESQLTGERPQKVYGDCEDYVLEKRRRLILAGVAPENLSIAIVLTSRGAFHAVLLVRTDRGEMVLDNRTYWIVTWDLAPYDWVERQVLGRADDWRRVVSKDEAGEATVTSVAALRN